MKRRIDMFSRNSTVFFIVGAMLAISIATPGCARGLFRSQQASEDRGDTRASDASIDLTRQSLNIQGFDRTFLTYRPRGPIPPGGWPLVIALHGGQGNGEKLASQTGFNATAEKYGFMVAYPNSLKYWNDGRDTTESSADDVGFIAGMIDHLVRTAQVNPRRVYATGISNGGMMTFRLACELNDRIAAFAPVAASLPVPYVPACRPKRSVSMLIIGSPDDPMMPWRGGEIRHSATRGVGGQVISVPDSVRFWKEKNHCGPDRLVQTIDKNPGDGTAVKAYEYENCDMPLRFTVIEGGGHVWPGLTERLGPLAQRLVGKSSEEINGADYVWNFFSKFSR